MHANTVTTNHSTATATSTTGTTIATSTIHTAIGAAIGAANAAVVAADASTDTNHAPTPVIVDWRCNHWSDIAGSNIAGSNIAAGSIATRSNTTTPVSIANTGGGSCGIPIGAPNVPDHRIKKGRAMRQPIQHWATTGNPANYQ